MLTAVTSYAAGEWHSALVARYADRVGRLRVTLPFAVTTFRDLPEDLHQPALVDDVLCLHRGGAKRVHRIRDGSRTVHDVPLHALTLMPRHRAADWRTEGPDDFLHITLNPKSLDDLFITECGKSRAEIELRDDVGFVQPYLCGLSTEMLRVAGAESESQLYVDTLFTAFALALLRHCSSERGLSLLGEDDAKLRSGGMAGWRLRQIVEYMTEHRASRIDFTELTRVSGLSRAHFFRAFRQATGMTPGRYLERIRVDEARRSIERGETLAEAAASAGFAGTTALSHAFRRVMEITPKQYRRWYK